MQCTHRNFKIANVSFDTIFSIEKSRKLHKQTHGITRTYVMQSASSIVPI